MRVIFVTKAALRTHSQDCHLHLRYHYRTPEIHLTERFYVYFLAQKRQKLDMLKLVQLAKKKNPQPSLWKQCVN
jgi:hypothetical protein